MGTATSQRIVLSDGVIEFTLAYAMFTANSLTGADRRKILGFCRTHFKYGGRIGDKNYSTARVITQVIAELPGQIKVYR